MTISLPREVPPRKDLQDGERVRLRALLLPAAMVAFLGCLGVLLEPSFLSPWPLPSLWMAGLLESCEVPDRIWPALIGLVHGLLFLAWTWPAIRRSPTRIPIAFLVLLGLLTVVNTLSIATMLAWTLIPVGVVPLLLLANGVVGRKEMDAGLLAWYYALVFGWFAFGALSGPPGAWI